MAIYIAKVNYRVMTDNTRYQSHHATVMPSGKSESAVLSELKKSFIPARDAVKRGRDIVIISIDWK